MPTVNPPPLPDQLSASKSGITSSSWTRWFQDLAVSVNRMINNMVIGTSITIPDDGLKIKDESGVYTTTVDQDRTLTANRILNLLTADTDQTLTINGSSITISGSNTGDQTITLTGDVTGTGTGSFATTYAGTVPVTTGGTGVTTMTTAYAPVCAGTTATGALQVASTGLSTSGYIFVSNGSSDKPSFQQPGWALLDTQTAANSATVNLTTLTGYTHYQIRCNNINPAAANGALYMRFSTDGGSNYDASAGNYRHQRLEMGSTTLTGARDGTTTTAFPWEVFTLLNSSATQTAAGIIDIYEPDEGTSYTMITSKFVMWDGANLSCSCSIEGGYMSATAVNAVRFLMSSGNLTTGTFKLYGIK